jgi:hypothetical protein
MTDFKVLKQRNISDLRVICTLNVSEGMLHLELYLTEEISLMMNETSGYIFISILF